MSVAHSVPAACSKYSLTHLPNDVLLRSLHAVVARDRSTTVEVLAHIAEVDRRRLFRPAGYPSMRAYCLGELHLSEDAAYKRIQSARTARDFPAIFDAVAEGRLHLSAVVLLAPHLTEETTEEMANELLAGAAHKSKSEVERFLAERFPKEELPTRVQAISQPSAPPSLAEQLAPGQVQEPAAAPAARPRVEPVAAARFSVQVTIGQSTHDKLRRAQELLSHALPSGDIAEVLDRALDALICKLEKRKFAATDRPRENRRSSSANSRHIPAHVRRAVRERDRDQCTFMSETGHRCEARSYLEFDHIAEFARGGEATVENLQLRCSVHNQYTAEQTFGVGFMSRKREEAQQAARAKREAAQARAVAEAEKAREQAEADAERAGELDVVPWLRRLGFRMDEARQAAKLCETIPDASLEERVKRALSFFRPRGTVRVAAPSP